MKRYLYYCPKCNFLGSAEHENPHDYQQCSDCKASMIYTGITKEEWDSKTREEKDSLKNQFKTELVNTSSIGKSGIDNDAILQSIKKMGNDISTIKNIMVVWVVLNLIGAFFALLGLVGLWVLLGKVETYLH